MTKVLFILSRTDHKPTMHDWQFIRETNDVQMENFVTTGDLRSAKRFASEIAAWRFLSRLNPANTATKAPRPVGRLACYTAMVLDLDDARAKIASGVGLKTLHIEATGKLFYITGHDRANVKV